MVDEDYARVILICSGQFNDPDLQCHLADITRQLHMLTTGAEEPLVTRVEPWNSVRVTLKVSCESAALLQTLAQQHDSKLVDIGILSVQVDGSNPVCLKQPDEASCKLNSADNRAKINSSARVVASSAAPVGICQPPVSSLVAPTVQDITCSHAAGVASNVNQSWHPLVDQKPIAATDEASCSWDPFGYNGLSVDPFQFSADDLLTRMLADVPAPKRRQRMRKGSTTSTMPGSFLSLNTAPFTPHGAEDCSPKLKLSNTPYPVSYGVSFGVPGGIQTLASQQMAYCDKDRMPVGNIACLSSPLSTQVNDLYNVRVGNNNIPAVSSHPLYSPHKDTSFSAASVLPFSLDSLMTVSNLANVEAKSATSDQPPAKKRRVKSRNSARAVASGAYGAVTETLQDCSFRDVCSDAISDAHMKNTNVIKQNEMHIPGAVSPRYVVHSPRALWSDTPPRGHSVLPPGYPGIDAYQFRLPHQQSSAWTHSSYMYGDVRDSSTSFLSDVRKPFCIAGGLPSQPTVTASLSNHCLSRVNEAASGTPWLPHPQPPFSAMELQRSGVCDRLTRPAGFPITSASVTSCVSVVDQPHVPAVGVRPTAASSRAGIVSETCSTMELSGIAPASSIHPAVVQSTSPRDGWTGSDSDYGGASVTDSGVASNTSLSVGSDHSENDRASVEMNAADHAGSAKLSPVSTADRVCPPSSPLLASAADRLTEQPPPSDGVASGSSSSSQLMWMNPLSAGQNGDSCITACKSSASVTEPQNWLSDRGSQSDSRKSAQSLPGARMRFARRSRQTPTLASECPPAITCPSLPRRLSESVKRAMRGGAAPDPPITSAPCDIGPTKVVIRITKTRCSGTGEAKKSKQKEQWCVQPIVKPFQSPPSDPSSDVVTPVNGTLHCTVPSCANDACTDYVTVPVTDSVVDKSPHRKESGIAAGKRDSCQSSGVSSRVIDSVVQQLDLFPPSSALSASQDELAYGDDMGSSGQESVAHGAVQLFENGAQTAAVIHKLT